MCLRDSWELKLKGHHGGWRHGGGGGEQRNTQFISARATTLEKRAPVWRPIQNAHNDSEGKRTGLSAPENIMHSKVSSATKHSRCVQTQYQMGTERIRGRKLHTGWSTFRT